MNESFPNSKIRNKIADMKFKFSIWKDIKLGYIAPDGEPLKCYSCKSTNLYTDNYDYICSTLCEYTCKCKDCGQTVGVWSYGEWQL